VSLCLRVSKNNARTVETQSHRGHGETVRKIQIRLKKTLCLCASVFQNTTRGQLETQSHRGHGETVRKIQIRLKKTLCLCASVFQKTTRGHIGNTEPRRTRRVGAKDTDKAKKNSVSLCLRVSKHNARTYWKHRTTEDTESRSERYR
jgi:hypothetical protein